MEQLQSYRFESVTSFEFVEKNELSKEENALVVMSGLGEWWLSLNPATVVAVPPTGVPMNVVGEETMDEGLLVLMQEVE